MLKQFHPVAARSLKFPCSFEILKHKSAKVLGDPISIVYYYGEYTEIKNADPERYSYVDVIYDAYCGILKDIPSGKTIKFSIKAILPNGDESFIEEDKDVMRMFEKSTDACDPIHCYVFGLEVTEEVSNVYWVNTFEGNVMQRPKTSVVNSQSRQRTPIKRHVQKTLANRSKSGVDGSKRIEKFSTKTYMLAYGQMIHSLPDLSILKETGGCVLQRPALKRQKGRPSKNRRRREPGEAASSDFRKRTGTVKCTRCCVGLELESRSTFLSFTNFFFKLC
ncbi:hypothetical protein NE237_032702 [Protea cynaroides]|uniref:Uncharacterized protein n=1 Tax=Protea cynaroides TaxID=273540 RepID=A0A9Q0R3D0_9MAGN|nr:hypothetical protein NE237_032702 [Protea cynaroides]